MISAAESERIRTLIDRFELSEVADIILDRCQPMITIALEELRVREHRRPLESMPIGASRWGAYPDVPSDLVWPRLGNGHPMHFLMQLDVASVPTFDGTPLPSSGMLYLFAGMEGHDYSSDMKILYSSTDARNLHRLSCAPDYEPDDLFLEYFSDTFEPFLLTCSLGADIRYRTEGTDLTQLIEERYPEANWQELVGRYSALGERAADIRFDTLESSGYPIHWWRVAQLFGATNPSQREDSARRYLKDNATHAEIRAESARWHRFISLESNAVTGFESLCDARPYRLLVREPEHKPWTQFAHVQTHIENG